VITDKLHYGATKSRLSIVWLTPLA